MSNAPQEKAEMAPEASALVRRQQEEWLDGISVVERMTPEQVALIKNTVAKDATKDELRMFIGVCAMTRLNPLIKQIHFVKRWDSRANDGKGGMVGAFQVGIDGFRVIAERSKTYAGKLREEWCGPDGKWVELWTRTEPPFAARVTVRRHDWQEPVSFIARWSAYVQTKKDGSVNSMWATRGPEQLAKCAEAGVLRIVAPNDLSGLELLDESAERVEAEERPLSVSAYTNTAKAAEAEARAAVDAALSTPAPEKSSGAEVVEGGGEAATAAPSAKATEPAPAATDTLDWAAETRAVLESIYGPKAYSTRGGPARLASARKELVTWGMKRGIAPAVVGEKDIYALAVAYRKWKAGEAGTDTAAAGTDAPLATEVPGEDKSEGSAGATEAEPGTKFDPSHLIARCREAAKAFGPSRPFVMEFQGVPLFVDKPILDALGSSDSLPIVDDPDIEPLLAAALPLVVAATAEHTRNNRPAPRGPSPL